MNKLNGRNHQRLTTLRGERRKLAARLAKIDTEISKLEPNQPNPTSADVDHWLDELTEGLPELPPLPPDFSRADLYNDHD